MDTFLQALKFHRFCRPSGRRRGFWNDPALATACHCVQFDWSGAFIMLWNIRSGGGTRDPESMCHSSRQVPGPQPTERISQCRHILLSLCHIWVLIHQCEGHQDIQSVFIKRVSSQGRVCLAYNKMWEAARGFLDHKRFWLQQKYFTSKPKKNLMKMIRWGVWLRSGVSVSVYVVFVHRSSFHRVLIKTQSTGEILTGTHYKADCKRYLFVSS